MTPDNRCADRKRTRDIPPRPASPSSPALLVGTPRGATDRCGSEIPVVAGATGVIGRQLVPLHEWVPGVARIVGAPPPRRVPAPVARLLTGSWAVS